MRNQLLERIREYYLGKLDAYENAMKLVDPRHVDTIHVIINDVKGALDFYNREIEKFKKELINK